MTSDDDEIDASDWLSGQFGEEEPKRPVKPPVTPAPPPFQPPPIVAPPPVGAPTPPTYSAPTPPMPTYPAPAAPGVWPPAAEQPAFPTAAPTPAQPPTPPPASPPSSDPGGFQWGLSPGSEPAPPAAQPPVTPPPASVPPTSAPATPPYQPPPFSAPVSAVPAEPTPFSFDQPLAYPPAPSSAPPSGFPAPTFPVEQPAEPAAPAFPWDAPTTAFPAPTTAFPTPAQQPPFPGQSAFPGQAVEPAPRLDQDPGQWFAAPLDPALEGVTEVFEAELVGATAPVGEGVAASALDDLFGDGQFRDFGDEPLIAPMPRTTKSAGGQKPPRGPRDPIPRTQKILMWVAGGLVAALALVALFAVGMKLASLAPAPAISPTPTPSASAVPGVLPVGPVKPGDYHWDELLGGECLKPFDSAWQDNYTVVDCTTAHPAQMVYRGTFTDPASATYPGFDELQKRINLLCTPATIINYAIAGSVQDIQVTASFAVDESQWDDGNHDYYCFVNRSGGEDFTASVAIQQVPVTPTPTASPTSTATPTGTKGHASGTKP